MPTLRLVVFDLDYTVWKPEMFQLCGAPRLVKGSSIGLSKADVKQARTNQRGMVLVDGDKRTVPITVFDGASFALAEIERLRQEGHQVYAAVASRCDETEYADICLKHLVIHGGKTLQECFQDRVQIDPYSDKTHHLQRLHEQTGIPFENMCFFDNEIWNIRCVSKLGVKSIYTPDGMTTEAWEEALSNFRLPS